MLRLSVRLPSAAHQPAMLAARRRRDPLDDLQAVADGAALLALQSAVHEVLVREPVARYLLRVVAATRDHAAPALGAPPPRALSFFPACQARAGRSLPWIFM